MDKPSKERQDRYDVSGNVEAEYVDEAKLVLKNKVNVTDLATLQRLEERLLAEAYDGLLREVRINTPIDSSAAGAEQYIEAAKAAFKRNYSPLSDIIRQALAEARRLPSGP